MNNCYIRDIEDLCENFNLDDILEHYRSGLLQRWLEVRNLTDYASQVADLNADISREAAEKLCKIFHKEMSAKDIADAMYPLKHKLIQEQRLCELKRLDFKREEVIRDYHSGYVELLCSMLNNKKNYPSIKAAISKVWADYRYIFFVDFVRFFDYYSQEAPVVLLAMLANKEIRSHEIIDNAFMKKVFDIITNRLNRNIIDNSNNKSENTICGFLSLYLEIKIEEETKKIEESHDLCPYYKTFAGMTDGYWKDLEPKGKKIMILSMEPGNFIRNSAKSSEELNYSDVNEKFLIVDGLDYKSNSASNKLIYMEV